jgi:hypothetical protein
MEKGTKDHAALAEAFIQDEEHVNWHDGALWWIRQKRDIASKQIPEWEALREAASRIKSNVLSNLHDYLLEFEANVTKNGVTVHWAADAEEHNRIVYSILKAKGNHADDQEQVDADGRMSPERIPDRTWYRRHQFGSGRIHSATGQRTAQPHCAALYSQTKGGNRRDFSRTPGHRKRRF